MQSTWKEDLEINQPGDRIYSMWKSRVRPIATPRTTFLQAFLSSIISRSPLKLTPTASVTPCSHLILCRPLLFLPSIVPSIRLFSRESFLLIRWPKYLSFIFRIWPSKEQSGLISSRTDWFDRLAVQGTRRSLIQHHNSKVSILWRSAFLMVQLSQPYIATGKTVALTIRTFVGRICHSFPSQEQASLNFLAAVPICGDLGAQEMRGLDAMILVFLMLSFKPTSALSSFTRIKRLFSSSSLSAMKVKGHFTEDQGECESWTVKKTDRKKISVFEMWCWGRALRKPSTDRKMSNKIPAFLNVVDIAGLVKGAHAGQGLGNAFLSHISACDGIFHLLLLKNMRPSTVLLGHFEGAANGWPNGDWESWLPPLFLRGQNTGTGLRMAQHCGREGEVE
ncbi:Obg-like ATPase 1 [Varanus komodoensis]|nr:Obg-like ATPase 1 [Varanus komodoensis]